MHTHAHTQDNSGSLSFVYTRTHITRAFFTHAHTHNESLLYTHARTHTHITRAFFTHTHTLLHHGVRTRLQEAQLLHRSKHSISAPNSSGSSGGSLGSARPGAKPARGTYQGPPSSGLRSRAAAASAVGAEANGGARSGSQQQPVGSGPLVRGTDVGEHRH